MQKWKKLGRVFNPIHKNNWMVSHAALPFIDWVGEDLIKIYFSVRDFKNRSLISFVLFDLNIFAVIKNNFDKPVLELGELGGFDDSGTMGCSIVNAGDRKLLYYIGWNLGVTVPFRNSIGLAVSINKGKSFDKFFKGPIIDRTKDEPHFVASNCVIKDGDVYKMWYLSCTEWRLVDGVPVHKYHIKYAISKDGVEWERNNIIAIDYKDEFEYAISAPSVIKENNVYKMWFSSRATKNIKTYRIRYAESEDGVNWIRKDEDVQLDVGGEGEWDAEMICYPHVFDHKGKRYMLYNGNGYGKTGFGLAVLED